MAGPPRDRRRGYKSFPVQRAVLRYVEANPVRAGLVARARDSPYASLAARRAGGDTAAWLAGWPVDEPSGWEAAVDRPQDDAAVAAIRASVARGRPFGTPAWVTRTVKTLGLQHTVRDPWRPRKPSATPRRNER